MHRHLPHLGVRRVDDDPSRVDVRIVEELCDVVDRRRRHAGVLEELHRLGERVLPDEASDDRIDLSPPLDPFGVGPERGIVVELLAPDGTEQPLGHGLRRRRDREPAAVLRRVHVTGRGRLRRAARTPADLAAESVNRRLGTEDRRDRVEQAQIDHLAAPAVPLDVADRDDGRHGAIESRDHAGHRQRRQHGLAVSKPLRAAKPDMASTSVPKPGRWR
jgi:hypothetical protein